MPRIRDDATRLQFTFEKHPDFVIERATCRHCHRTIAHTASKLRKHLDTCDTYKRSAVGQQQLESRQVVTLSNRQMEKLRYASAKAIFKDGRSANLFQGTGMKEFLSELNPAFKPASTATILGTYLPQIYKETKDAVKELVNNATHVNVILDGSDIVSGHRVLNCSLQLPRGVVVYWQNKNTEEKIMNAEAYLQLTKEIMHDVFNDGNFSRLNSFSTDTNSTMRSFHRLLSQDPEFKHCFTVLCDSHGLQLLIKDVLEVEPWKHTIAACKELIATMKTSKLQLARLREFQMRLYQRHHSLLQSYVYFFFFFFL